jgi:hypothetical protein
MEISENDKKGLENLKIGKLVNNLMTLILQKELISDMEIQNLEKKDYSKFTFNVIFPLLKKVDSNISLKENGLIKGRPRYYANPIEYKNVQYLLTNEWKEYHREDFMNWFQRKVKD